MKSLAGAAHGEVTARPCPGCGYDLRGMHTGGRCPECGLSALPSAARDAPLSAMPVAVVRRFRDACWLATGVLLAFGVLLAVRMWMRQWPTAWWSAVGVVSVVWMIAVWRLTPAIDAPAAVVRGFSSRGVVRRLARMLVVGWLFTAVAGVIRVNLPPITAATPARAAAAWTADVADATLLVGVAAGVAGIVLLGLQLARLAEWARDQDAEIAFGIALWGIPLTTPMLYVADRVLIVMAMVMLLWVLAVGAFPYALISLTKSLAWSVRHARENLDREQRRRAIRDADDARIAASIARIDAASPDRERP